MSSDFNAEQRSGPRYVVSVSVRAEWDEQVSGKRIIAEGTTENIGPGGALVHLPQLPEVGSRVELAVLDEGITRLQVPVEVLRLERNPVQPLAALQLLEATDEWRGLVWEPAKVLFNTIDTDRGEDFDY